MSKIINCEELVVKMEQKHGMVFTKLERALLESAVLMGAKEQHEKSLSKMQEWQDKIASFEKKLNDLGDNIQNKKSSIWNLFK